jgi:hypothetical protein
MTNEERAISAAARAISDKIAKTCGVDPHDNWAIYGSDTIEDCRLIIETYKAKLEELQ